MVELLVLIITTTTLNCTFLLFRVQFAPEVDVSKPKRIFEISDDGLVLTIKNITKRELVSLIRIIFHYFSECKLKGS